MEETFTLGELIAYKEQELWLEEAKLYRGSFYEFFKGLWPFVGKGNDFVDNWHIQAIAEHLEACFHRQIRKLIINVPPRSTKSVLTSVAFPIWCWINNPKETFLMASYGSKLSEDFAKNSREILYSHWFLSRFGEGSGYSHPVSISPQRDTVNFYANTAGGYRITTSVGGTVTGLGAGIKILDDPCKMEEGKKNHTLDYINEWVSQTWLTRSNNPKRDVDIIVMQRVACNDVAGYLMRHDHDSNWVRLILPNEYEVKRKCTTIGLGNSSTPWEDPRVEEGEFLSPNRFGKEETRFWKRELGEYGYAGQHQQRPSPLGGGIIKGEWFRRWQKSASPNHIFKIVQSWDTAFKDKEYNDFSVCTTWGIFSSEELDLKKEQEQHYNLAILLSMWRKRVNYPELRDRAIRLCKNYTDTGPIPCAPKFRNRPDIILMEDKASGQSLIYDLYDAGITNLIATNPAKYGDKTQRLNYVGSFLEAGLVYLVASPPGFTELRESSKYLLDECVSFPRGVHDDIVDTMSQFLIYAKKMGILSIPTDPISFYEEPDREEIKFF